MQDILVKQFRRGTQGLLESKDIVRRKVHTCRSFTPPVFGGDCRWRTFQWCWYRGVQWQVKTRAGEMDHIELPGEELVLKIQARIRDDKAGRTR